MEHHGGHLGAAACLGMCLAMMVPMMLPALVPMLLRYRRGRAGGGKDAAERADVGGGGGLLRGVGRGWGGDVGRECRNHGGGNEVGVGGGVEVGRSGVVLIVAGGVQVSSYKARQLARWQEGLELRDDPPGTSKRLAPRAAVGCTVRTRLRNPHHGTAHDWNGERGRDAGSSTRHFSREACTLPLRVAQVSGVVIISVGVLTIARV